MKKLAIIFDYAEEEWFSMDLVGEMLFRGVRDHFHEKLSAHPIRPAMKRRFTKIPGIGEKRLAFNIDRFINRFIEYPLYLRKIRHRYDFFHVCGRSGCLAGESCCC